MWLAITYGPKSVQNDNYEKNKLYSYFDLRFVQ